MIGTTPGSVLTLHGYYDDGATPPVPTTPVSPTIIIINPDDSVVVNAIPTIVATGHATYDYTVGTVLGTYLAQWGGTIAGVPTFGVEAFEVRAPGASSTTTLQNLIDMTRQYLYTGTQEAMSKLNAGITASATSLTLTYDNAAFQPGSRVSCELEDMYVWERTGNTLIVDRGRFGTAASTHADTSLLYAQPKFSDAEIVREINNELRTLPSNGIYAVGNLDVTTSAVRNGYDLPTFTTGYEILEVHVRSIGPSDSWPMLQSWEHIPSADPTDFSSGHALYVMQPVEVPTTLRVTYKYPFATFTALTDIAADIGLTSSLLDIPPISAAIRLTAGREIKRNFDETQGDTRRAGEVPAGANLGSSRELQRLRQRRLSEEAANLKRLYPPRLKRERMVHY